MALDEYKRKRDFTKTPEPSGDRRKSREMGLSYLIQKHAATRLHYDFRLELNGVLLSWAVTKGPSLSPADKRLAVRTEDHPLEYGSFEGTIPKGQYGGGTVMLWDTGTWEPKGDPNAGLKKGHLAFVLHGKRLKGGWDLVRMRTDEKRENWLLIKENDKEADADGKKSLEDFDVSVTTGRTMEAIAEGAPAVRDAGRPKQVKPQAKSAEPPAAKKLAGPLGLEGITVTHPDRVISETGHITKGQVAEYYAAVAPVILPSLVQRPLSLLRCPSGVEKQCFYQRNPGRGLGPDVHPFQFKHRHELHEYLYIEDTKGLIELIQMGAIEIHPWGSRIDSIDFPDRLIFDLDPAPNVPFEAVKLAAQDLRTRLQRRGLESVLKCTGGKGLHVTVPLPAKDKWPEVKAFGADLAAEMVAAAPEAYIATMSKAKRAGKIFIDYFRNDYTATAICDYGVRARPGAPVAMPIDWDELERVQSADQFTMNDALKRVASRRGKASKVRNPKGLPKK
jgi:bifunctional non-homologous end joining protein LigD